MKNVFFSKFDSDNLRKTLIYLVIALLLITLSPLFGHINGDFLPGIMFFIGFVMFFYAALHPWEKAIYYFTLMVISIILFLLLLFVGIGILMKIHLNMKVEDIAGPIGFVLIAGFLTGIIGMFRFRKYD